MGKRGVTVNRKKRSVGRQRSAVRREERETRETRETK
jgi:hypothetical protein